MKDLTADYVDVETPEHVVVRFELAGGISRILAALIDAVIQVLILAGIGTLLLFVALGAGLAGGEGMMREASLATCGIALVLMFLDIFGYSVLFELFLRGQTPGKWCLGLRVIREGGYALTPAVVLARNMMRIVDFFPFGYALGAGVACLNRQNRRVGDFVAGTLVVRDARPPALAVRPHEARRADPTALAWLRLAGVHRLSIEHVQVVEGFLARRDLLEPRMRQRIAGALAARIAGVLGVEATIPEVFLTDVLVAYHEAESRSKGDGFVRQRVGEWARLAEYSDRIGAGSAASLTPKEQLEFIALYRRVTADLARARMLKARPDVIEHLNGLVGRIHVQIYVRPGFRAAGIVEYFTGGFPRAVRRQAGWVFASILMLVVPAIAAGVAVQADPSLGRVFVPPQFYDNVGHYDETGRSGGQVAMMTGFYIFNNVRVSIAAFALGMFFGLGSAYILVMNGAILGAMTAIIAQHRHSWPFWSFVASHGAIEMTAIVMAGAAGMMVGSKLINPGPHTRVRALIEAGREAGLMLYGIAAMLCVAAVLEAAVSPSTLPGGVKIALGSANLVLVVLYFTVVGRPRIASSRDS